MQTGDRTQVLPEDAIVIGLCVPLSGQNSIAGLVTRKAVTLAIEEINAKGGVLNRPLALLPLDSEGNRALAVSNASQMIDTGVVAIIGAVSSSVTTEIASQVTIDKNMVLISPRSTSPVISSMEDNQTLWRTVASDIYQAKIAAEEAYAQGYRKVSTLCVDNAYGNLLTEAFVENFLRLGGSVYQRVSYPELESSELNFFSFKGYVAQLFDSEESPDMVYCAMYTEASKISSEMAPYLEAHQVGVMVSESSYRDNFLNNADEVFLSLVRGTVPYSLKEDETYQQYEAAYRERYLGEEPPALTATGYDAVYLLALAMEAAGSTDTNQLKQYLGEVSGPTGVAVTASQWEQAIDLLRSNQKINYEGASGKIDFDENGDVTSGNYAIWSVKEGSFVIEKVKKFPE
ncbi:ABC transporter substrate-binding protein [Algivirga pacifica]|uniref:ABC transporter substrate-binding protein n=2 Tax=Algivirga pacifica TaxID=1162670 RepID=A0ABP9DQJ8_9BACT